MTSGIDSSSKDSAGEGLEAAFEAESYDQALPREPLSEGTADFLVAPTADPIAWLGRHAQAAVSSAGGLVHSPSMTLATVALIAIALALPAGLYAMVDRLQVVAAQWQTAVQVSVFMTPTITEREAESLAAEWRGLPEVEGVEMVGRAAALLELQDSAGLSGLNEVFGTDNPLPVVLMVTADGELTRPEAQPALNQFIAELRANPKVELVQFNQRWIGKLQAVLALLSRVTLVVGALVACALVLSVAQAIRSAFEHRREEVTISRLCGATDSFIRRPFLYTGVWYGLIGAAVAVAVVMVAAESLSEPFHSFLLQFPEMADGGGLGVELLFVVFLGPAIGWAGARIAVARQLRSLEL